MCCSRRRWAGTPRLATWRDSSSASRPRPWRSTPRDAPRPGDRSRPPRVLSRAQLVLRAAARALDPGDLGADGAGRGRGLPAPDAERRAPADHDPGPRPQRERDDRDERDGDPHARVPQLRGRRGQRRLRSRSSVSSLEPALTTATSKLRYSSVRIAVTLVSMVGLSLWAGARIVVGGGAARVRT